MWPLMLAFPVSRIQNLDLALVFMYDSISIFRFLHVFLPQISHSVSSIIYPKRAYLESLGPPCVTVELADIIALQLLSPF